MVDLACINLSFVFLWVNISENLNIVFHLRCEGANGHFCNTVKKYTAISVQSYEEEELQLDTILCSDYEDCSSKGEKIVQVSRDDASGMCEVKV